MDKDPFRHKGGADTKQGGKGVIVKGGPPFFQGIIGCRLDTTDRAGTGAMGVAALPDRRPCFERKRRQPPWKRSGWKTAPNRPQGIGPQVPPPAPCPAAHHLPTRHRRQTATARTRPAVPRSVAAQAEPQPGNPCGRNRHADRQQTPQYGSTCGRVRRAHQAKSSDAALFLYVPGRHGSGMVVGFACDGVEKHGAHGAPYRRRNPLPVDFSCFQAPPRGRV